MEVRFDGHCFGCGPLNPEGLRLVFVPGPDGSVALTLTLWGLPYPSTGADAHHFYD